MLLTDRLVGQLQCTNTIYTKMYLAADSFPATIGNVTGQEYTSSKPAQILLLLVACNGQESLLSDHCRLVPCCAPCLPPGNWFNQWYHLCGTVLFQVSRSDNNQYLWAAMSTSTVCISCHERPTKSYALLSNPTMIKELLDCCKESVADQVILSETDRLQFTIGVSKTDC